MSQTDTTHAASPLANALNWFEIPVSDVDRAQAFYEALLGTAMRREPMGPQTLVIFPYQPGQGVGGALFAGPHAPQPAGAAGVLIYLNGGTVLEAALARLAQAGGRIVRPRVDLPEGMGSFVHFEDCEGNVLGLHAAS